MRHPKDESDYIGYLVRQIDELEDYSSKLLRRCVHSESECDRLREYVRRYAAAIEDCGCDHCPFFEDDSCDVESRPMRDGCRLYLEMQVLGIEVSE